VRGGDFGILWIGSWVGGRCKLPVDSWLLYGDVRVGSSEDEDGVRGDSRLPDHEANLGSRDSSGDNCDFVSSISVSTLGSVYVCLGCTIGSSYPSLFLFCSSVLL